MPNRIIREGLLDSQRYWSCTIEARELFVHLTLLADDFGCVSLAPTFVRRRCFESAPTSEKLAGFLSQLCDADLLRRYEVDGTAYGFIPRFRQRLQRMTLKHPKPPSGIFEDDGYAVQQFKQIKDERANPTDAQRVPTGSPSVAQHAEVEVEVEVKGSEQKLKGREAGGKGARSAMDLVADLAARQTRLK